MAGANGPRVGIIGLGGFGLAHLRCYLKLGIVPVGLSDPSLDRLAEAARQCPGAATAADPVALLDEVALDAVSIASPSSTHTALALAAAGRGIRVLLEKPVALSLAEARQVLAAGLAPLVTPGHVLRFSEPHRWLRSQLASGRIGAVQRLRAERAREAGHVRYGDPDPIFLTQIHDLDLASWLTGGSLPQVSTVLEPDNGVATLATTRGRADNDVDWELVSSWQRPADTPGYDDIELVGPAGALGLTVDGARTTGWIRRGSGQREDVRTWTTEDAPGLETEISEFVEDVAGRRPSGTIRFADAATVVAMAEAARRSGRSGGRARKVEAP
ncbi:Gfo/Idh/MocA family protein [Jiangella muralis]|uniref:Gfo/Idh/MocA family protein n=1 Tax=Jiangella muralis TaxID=702383 RepID=UPI00069DC1B8|nr:Gfo/Idh/MocA family oxidoreductase [Jiangella muralis]